MASRGRDRRLQVVRENARQRAALTTAEKIDLAKSRRGESRKELAKLRAALRR